MAMKLLATESGRPPRPAIQTLQTFARQVGISSVTAWRFRRRGWLSTVNIAGRPYVTAEEVDRFTRLAVAGEFAQEHTAPKRAKSVKP
jgi:hypothetical protein